MPNILFWHSPPETGSHYVPEPGCPGTLSVDEAGLELMERSACLFLLHAGIKGVQYDAWLWILFLRSRLTMIPLHSATVAYTHTHTHMQLQLVSSNQTSPAWAALALSSISDYKFYPVPLELHTSHVSCDFASSSCSQTTQTSSSEDLSFHAMYW